MANLVEWQVREGGWVQVFVEPQHAGSSMVNLAVDDLDGATAAMAERGITPGATQRASRGVELATMRDPDGNAVTLIGGFRVDY